MIEGVKVKKIIKHCDDRGFFAEIVRDSEGLLETFAQASVSMSYPGVIKAFHYHDHQDDLWYFPVGNAQVVLYDLRKKSATFAVTDVFYMGEDNPIILLIPKGVAHGYRVLGNKPATIVYFTSTEYDPKNPDEKRIAFDDMRINFNWTTKNK